MENILNNEINPSLIILIVTDSRAKGHYLKKIPCILEFNSCKNDNFQMKIYQNEKEAISNAY